MLQTCEDRCRTHSRAAPQALAAMRNTALTIIRRSGRKPFEGFEHFAEHRQQAIDAATGRNRMTLVNQIDGVVQLPGVRLTAG